MRVVRGLGALGVLVAGVGVSPWALIAFGRFPSAQRLQPSQWLLPDDGSLLLGALTVLGWLAWALFTLSVAVEVLSQARGRRLDVRLPGLNLTRSLASGLVVAVASLLAPALGAGTHSAAAVAGEGQAAAPMTVNHAAATAENRHQSEHGSEERETRQAKTYRVRSGDDLWSLAEQFYGDGSQWTRIARANRSMLTGGPDRLEVGWRLHIPGADLPQEVTVRRGDSLSSIAERELGDSTRWQEIYRLNTSVVHDPDVLEPGWVLHLPSSPAVRANPTADAHHNGVGKQRQEKAREASRDPDSRHATPHPAQPAQQPSGPVTPSASSEVPASVTAQDRASSEAQASQGAEPSPSAEARASAAAHRSPQPTAAAAPSAPSQTRGEPFPSELTPASSPEPSLEAEGTAATSVGVIAAPLGLLAAAGLAVALRRRRELQLRARPVGRRLLPHDAASAPLAQVSARAAADPSIDMLARVRSALAADAVRLGAAPTTLAWAWLGPQELRLRPVDDGAAAPIGFRRVDDEWEVSIADCAYLPRPAGADTAYPALVSLGQGERGALLIDLEAVAMLTVAGEDADSIATALALELQLADPADGVRVTLVGAAEAAWGVDVVTADNGQAIAELEASAQARRAALARLTLSSAAQARLHPELAADWKPHIVVFTAPLAESETARVSTAVSAELGLAAVLVQPDATPFSDGGPGSGDAPHRTSVTHAGAVWTSRAGVGTLTPGGLTADVQPLHPATAGAVESLHSVTGCQQDGTPPTTPAPWWTDAEEAPAGANITPLRPRPTLGTVKENAPMPPPAGVFDNVAHPTVLLLGPLDLLGARGTPPTRARRQCLEYCTWLLEHPGLTSAAMATALFVAEGTRRSNMSRLRAWLGEDETGRPYLPDAYSGRIFLDSAVSSDWRRLQILIAGGVNRAQGDALIDALQLVRGAPLADAAPGQWHWAEELRTDMVSTIRDVGATLTEMALAERHIDLARWATGRALTAAPEDELLMRLRVLTEHRAGNRVEVERLVRHVTHHARNLGVDLSDDTIGVLQEAVEGRPRQRWA